MRTGGAEEALEAGARLAGGLDVVPHVTMGGKTDPQIMRETLGLAGVDSSVIDGLVPVALEEAARSLGGCREFGADPVLPFQVAYPVAIVPRGPDLDQAVVAQQVVDDAAYGFGLRLVDYAVALQIGCIRRALAL